LFAILCSFFFLLGPTLHPGLRPEEVAPSAQLSLYCVTGSAGILAGSDNHFRQNAGKDAGAPSIFKLIIKIVSEIALSAYCD